MSQRVDHAGGGREPRALVPLIALLVLGCGNGTKYIGSNPGDDDCTLPAPPPPELALDPFYTKYLDARGVPVLSSTNVSDLALERACDVAVHLLTGRSDVHARLIENGLRVAVIGRNEVITDLPDYRDLNIASAETGRDREIRSLGATLARPVSSAAEENLLCLADDPFSSEFLLVHSLAHGLRRLGIVTIDADWDARLLSAYSDALSRGLWADTYAATDAEQYWAEGVQGFYDANRQSVPANGVHNHVNTRAELRDYDAALATLIADYFPDDSWRPVCP